MLANYFNITIIEEWLCLLAAIFLLDKKTGKWRWFIALLVLTVTVEATGWYLHYIARRPNNALPFNILMLVNSTFLMVFFGNDKSGIDRRYTNLIALCFIVSGLINLVFIQGYWMYNFYSEALGDILVSCVCFYFFYKQLTKDGVSDTFSNEYFWLASGVLISSLGGAVLYIFVEPLQMFYRQTHVNVYGYINYSLSTVLYGTLIIAFVCRRKNTNLLPGS